MGNVDFLQPGNWHVKSDYFVQLPVPDTMTNGQCVVEAEISLSKVTGDPKDDTVAAVKWEYEGCAAATAGLAGVRTAIRSRFDSLT